MSQDKRPAKHGETTDAQTHGTGDGQRDPQPILTTRQGHPVHNNQALRTIGNRGPATLENYHFFEKMASFDRERIPERVVHARGFVAYGEFEAYGTIGDAPARTYTRAKLLQDKGKKTLVVVRFSTVIGGRDSPRPRATRGGSRSSSRPRTATGIWWAITCRSSSFATRLSSQT
jgi:catalase